MSKTLTGGAVCRGFESEAPAAEEVVCSSKQFSFQMCLESGDGSRTFITGDRKFQTAGAVILNASHWKFILVAG